MANRENDIIRRTRRVVLAGVALLAFGLVGSVVCWRLRLGHEVNGRLRALRAAGLPTSGAELNKWYAAVPDSENAALVMTQAFALMRTFPDTRSNEVSRFQPPPRGQLLTTEQREILTRYVEMNTAALAKAQEALILPKTRYPVDFSPSAEDSVPHLGKLRGLAQIANFDALLALDSQKYADATTSIATLLGLARTLDEEPMLLSQLVRVALIRMATATVERTLAAGQMSDTNLQCLAAALLAGQKTNLMARALIGERALTIRYFRTSWEEITRAAVANEDGTEDPLARLSPVFAKVTGVFDRDLGFYLNAMETNITLASLPLPQSLSVTNVANEQMLEAHRLHHFVSGLLLPLADRALLREGEGVACLTTAQAALAVERFRLAIGRLPKDLHELVPGFLPSLPVDPFDGAALRYKQLPKGYVIYSVGPDGHDDGGKEPPSKRRGTERVPEDITFTVER